MENLHIVNLSQYNKPQIKEDKRRDWVAYGDDNNYYQYLIDLYINSTTNNAVINGISNMIYGKGLDALDSSTKTDEYAALRSIVHNDCLKKIALDLKLLGEASFQILYQDGKVVRAEHFPRQTLRAEKYNDDGDIEAYYYHANWEKIKHNEKPERISAFGFGNGKSSEIYIVKKYVSGYDYYCPVDYQGGLAYAELESEIADYLINDVQCGFSGTKVVNFNNGVPDREKQLQIKSDVLNKLTGARGEKVIIAFNNNAESKTTVDDIPLTDAPAHYEYLSSECATKLMVAHRVTSPLLLGIRDGNNGLGNNADEIKTASLLFNNITIKPYQDLIIEALDQILAVNEISLKLYFKTLQPLEFIETDNAITDESREEETGVKLTSQKIDNDTAIIDDRLAYSTIEKAEQIAKDLGCNGYHEHEFENQTWYMPCEEHKLSDDKLNSIADVLIDLGEDEDLTNWELVNEQKVDYDKEDKLDKMIGLANTGSARPNSKSKQDGEVEKEDEVLKFKVRYSYSPARADSQSREFCRKMAAAKKVYRKEDIISMDDKVVNAGWGPNGSDTYSIWLYKGGGSCRHFWMRRTYMAKDVTPDVKNPNAEISVNEAKKKGFTPETNDSKVAKRPRDQKNRGFLQPKSFKTPKSKGV